MAGCCFERLLFAISVTFDEYLNSFKNYQRDELGSGIIEVIRQNGAYAVNFTFVSVTYRIISDATGVLIDQSRAASAMHLG